MLSVRHPEAQIEKSASEAARGTGWGWGGVHCLVLYTTHTINLEMVLVCEEKETNNAAFVKTPSLS